MKFSRYAARRIPVYWIIKAKRRFVHVYDTPQGRGKSARYTHMRTFSGTEAIPVVIDGREVGSVVVAELFPEDTACVITRVRRPTRSEGYILRVRRPIRSLVVPHRRSRR